MGSGADRIDCLSYRHRRRLNSLVAAELFFLVAYALLLFFPAHLPTNPQVRHSRLGSAHSLFDDGGLALLFIAIAGAVAIVLLARRRRYGADLVLGWVAMTSAAGLFLTKLIAVPSHHFWWRPKPDIEIIVVGIMLGLFVLGAVHFFAANVFHGKTGSVETVAQASVHRD